MRTLILLLLLLGSAGAEEGPVDVHIRYVDDDRVDAKALFLTWQGGDRFTDQRGMAITLDGSPGSLGAGGELLGGFRSEGDIVRIAIGIAPDAVDKPVKEFLRVARLAATTVAAAAKARVTTVTFHSSGFLAAEAIPKSEPPAVPDGERR